MSALANPPLIFPRLSGSRTLLRLLTADDAEAIEDYTSRNVAHFEPTSPPREPEYYTRAYWRKLAPRVEEEFLGDRGVRFVLVKHADPERVIGLVNFGQIVRGAFQACYLGYEIDGKEEGKGLMTEALRVAIPYIFGERNLHRIMANHLPDNTKSARVLQKLGFHREGIAPRYLFIAGAWRDHVLTSLTNDQWRGTVRT